MDKKTTERVMNNDNQELYRLWDDFLEKWPVERVRTMSLEEYSSSGSENTFTYWIEQRLRHLGSVRGGSSFKFGIYFRKDEEQQVNGSGRTYSGQYAWYTKYGSTADEAFENVRQKILEVINAVKDADLDAIQRVDLGDGYKWKIAFHYQDRAKPIVSPVYQSGALRALTQSPKNISLPDIYRSLIKEKHPEIDLLDFGRKLWTRAEGMMRIWKVSHGSNVFTEEERDRYLKQKLIVVSSRTKKGQGEAFGEDMQVGDLFYLCYGAKQGVVLLGRVTSRAVACSKGDAWLQRSYEIVKHLDDNRSYSGEQKGWAPNYRSTCKQVPSNELKLFEIELLKPFFDLTLEELSGLDVVEDNEQSMKEDLSENVESSTENLILYGPPGTGKTYNTVNHALALCEGLSPEVLESEPREALQTRFQLLQKSGQIAFVTFHQSMSYEDFVEGIKPQTADDGVSYSVTPGLFLEICERARDNWECSQMEEPSSFDGLWSAYTKTLQQGEADSLEVKTKRGAFSIYEVGERTVYFEKQNGSRTHTLSIKTLKRLFQNPDQLLALGGLKTYYRGVLEALGQMPKVEGLRESQKQYVLIIDEINRGNVSAILGELITLLEPDKRLGQENELRVTLPYSQDPDFGVPPNLHIIATMNTADRSVEALDTALRRRFTFEEMMPDPSLLSEREIDGVDLRSMLNAINRRLEVLVGRDHTIGHAFFMRVSSLADLIDVFRAKVIPQLQEYFYGDWEKINLVLGNAFVNADTSEKTVVWPKDSKAPEDIDDRKMWKITPVDKWDIEAFKSIYGTK